MKGSVATAALLGLAVFPGARGHSWSPDPIASCGLVGCEGAAEAQDATGFDGSAQRSLHETDDANDNYDTVSPFSTEAFLQGVVLLVGAYVCHA